jgi:hypothetical protein
LNGCVRKQAKVANHVRGLCVRALRNRKYKIPIFVRAGFIIIPPFLSCCQADGVGTRVLRMIVYFVLSKCTPEGPMGRTFE